ncbi:hypothetical protein ASE14_07680 [Agromyces sp. Root81]|uniref:hypothetical protein n=1 Tax=Agromyces sp. Root81 TaxID=1736601 RepID=UPI0007011D01|nr:hypothetical protein [Agromyces sp. Root81]KRC60841.1 hypothetical protein ASE14_07680 [Agromyces sp. Root81]
MPEGLWWLPSLLVFAAAAAALVGAVVALRRSGARRERTALAEAAAAEVRAKGLIVQADNAVRDAERELSYAEAQFGADEAHALRTALGSARKWMREAFILQQRLDDAEADSAAERRTWSARIEGLCTSAIGALDDAEAALAARRRTERGAPEELPSLRAEAERLARRRIEAEAMLGRLGTRFTPSALESARGAVTRVDGALAEAAIALDDAEGRLGRSEPTSDLLGTASGRLERAGRELDGIDAVELALAAAQQDAADEAAALDRELVAARRERDAQEDPDSGEALGAVIGTGSAAMAGRAELAGDPVADRDRLRACRDRLEVARAAARNAQGRLDGARGALGGAMAIAESQLRVARAAIDRGGRAVGADARTRLAEAERQLVIARQEPDPVAALDAARRSTSRASDAEALALYRAGTG